MLNLSSYEDVAATKGYGSRVVKFDRYSQDRELIGCSLAEKHGLTLIPSDGHAGALVGTLHLSGAGCWDDSVDV
jgi:threonine dehydratase